MGGHTIFNDQVESNYLSTFFEGVLGVCAVNKLNINEWQEVVHLDDLIVLPGITKMGERSDVGLFILTVTHGCRKNSPAWMASNFLYHDECSVLITTQLSRMQFQVRQP